MWTGTARSAEPRVLQSCHNYDGSFLDCVRQYASLFAGTPYKVTTVSLAERSDPEVATHRTSDEVLFLEHGSKDIRGLKLKAVRDLCEIAHSCDLRFCIAHRFKPIRITSLATRLPIVGVYHAFGDYQRLSCKVFADLVSKRLSLLAASDAMRNDIRRYLPKWPAGRIEALYSRIDVAALQAEQIERLDMYRQLCLPDETWAIDNVDRLHPDEDQATLLCDSVAVLPRLPQSSLLTALDGGCLEEQFKNLACELGIGEHVLSLGQVEEARHYFKAFDAFVLSSDHELFGMVSLKAMIAGVPLIATACGGAREVMEGVSVLFPLGDEMALTEGLTHLAALDRRQREACARLMLEHLEIHFSGTTVRREFWRLSTITGFVLESAC